MKLYYPGGPRINKRVLNRNAAGSESERERWQKPESEREGDLKTPHGLLWRWRKGLWAKGRRWLHKSGKGREAESPLKPSQGRPHSRHLHCRPARLWPPENQGCFKPVSRQSLVTAALANWYTQYKLIHLIQPTPSNYSDAKCCKGSKMRGLFFVSRYLQSIQGQKMVMQTGCNWSTRGIKYVAKFRG